jgi:hypothetical protein
MDFTSNQLTTHHTHTFITTSLVCAYYFKQVEVDTTFMNQPLLCGSKTPWHQTIFHFGNQFYIHFSISFRIWAFVWSNVCKLLNHLLNLVLSHLNLFLWFCVRIVKSWFNVSYACFQVVAISQITKNQTSHKTQLRCISWNVSFSMHIVSLNV